MWSTLPSISSARLWDSYGFLWSLFLTMKGEGQVRHLSKNFSLSFLQPSILQMATVLSLLPDRQPRIPLSWSFSILWSMGHNPAGTPFCCRDAGRMHPPCNTSRLEALCVGTVSGWKHDMNCDGLKNLSVHRATVTRCERLILFLLQRRGSSWQWGLLSQEDAGWKEDIGCLVKKWVARHCGNRQSENPG